MQHSYETQGRYYTAMQTAEDNYKCSEMIEDIFKVKVIPSVIMISAWTQSHFERSFNCQSIQLA